MEDRIPIPGKLSAEVMNASDNTCCVCTERGKRFQIHHIDANPGNNVFENLAVLCTECHEETQLKGGFTRKLTSKVVTEFRDNWIKRVRSCRKKRDETVVSMQAGKHTLNQGNQISGNLPEQKKLRTPPIALINSFPILKATLSAQVQPKRDTESTFALVQASRDYIDSIVGILIALCSHYAENPFGNQTPEEYFSDMVASKYQWHRAIAEPDGHGTGGTIVSLYVASGVKADVEKMVEDMVDALVGDDVEFDFLSWQRCWRGDKTEC